MAALNAISRRLWRTSSSRSSVARPSSARAIEPPRKRLKLSASAASTAAADDDDDDMFPPSELLPDPALAPHDSALTTTDENAHHDAQLDKNEFVDDQQDELCAIAFGARQSNGARPRSARSRHAPPSRPRPRRDRDQIRSTRRPAANPRPRYSNAAAAAAASQAHDGYKPREERSWEDFHPDLDLDAPLMLYTADQVDGRVRPEIPASSSIGAATENDNVKDSGTTDINHPDRSNDASDDVTPRRRPGRPYRKPESMLNGLGSPLVPRIAPLPTHNPKERLNLPKPSFRLLDAQHDNDHVAKLTVDNYVDKSMANVGYQETERFDIPRDFLIRHIEGPHDDGMSGGFVLESDGLSEPHPAPQVGFVEYDMDEQDGKWLEDHNHHRKSDDVDPIKPAIFEITMTQIEREFYALEKRIPKQNARHTAATRPRSSSAAAVNGEPPGAGDEPDSKCAICDEGDCENANAIIFCDGCDLAVHQECYGVPFIPEGQWFCRKCKEIGRGTPTCIFCPNVDGAFKQTNTLRWSHLLCAIWIPEVTIANPTFMDSIQDVDKVPRSRWTLHCYICNQRMGACIQCSKSACYQAFHVTCARRAKLYLKMKSSPTGGLDASVLKASCDKHVPSDWRREHDVDSALADAKRYYRRSMKDRKWADSRVAANLAAQQTPIQSHVHADAQREALTTQPSADEGANAIASAKKKKKDQKTGWKLPSGAPVVPMVVFNAVEASLARFMLLKRKEFTAEICKYWTLKREARRGAALLKRLQLQLESFSSLEISRRNFVGMGAAGRPRLLRRIEFAELLETDLDHLTKIVQSVGEREQKKLQDAEHLRHLFDTVYFPMSDLLWPIYRKAQKLGEKTKVFEQGFADIERKLKERFYMSAAVFSADLGSMFAAILAPDVSTAVDIATIHNGLAKGPLTWAERQAIPAEDKEMHKIAKRIVRAVYGPLQVVLEQEASLKAIPPDTMADVVRHVNHDVKSSIEPVSGPSIGESFVGLDTSNTVSSSTNDDDVSRNTRQSSPSALKDDQGMPDDHWAQGGVPWYLSSFDPIGTTFHQERETENNVRAGSEALSEMDDDTLQELEASAEASAEREGEVFPQAAASKAKKASRNIGSDGRGLSRNSRSKNKSMNGGFEKQLDDYGDDYEEAKVDGQGGEADGETEEEQLAREKREKYNAKRRAQRRSGR